MDKTKSEPLRSQWECFLENLGEWQGSFTRFSPQGELLEDTPSIVSFAGQDNNQRVRQVVRRFYPDATGELQPQDLVLEYTSLNRSLLFFDNGAFSQGAIQLAPFSEFGAELGLIHDSRRQRLVQVYDRDGQLDRLTLIRERLVGVADPRSGHLTRVEDLLGEWQGEAVTMYPDWRSPDTYATKLQTHLDDAGRLVQQLSFGDRTITSSGEVHGSILRFQQGSQPVQVLLLPDGASATSPLQVKVGQSFFLETGWLIQPDLRQRMIRSYNDKGEWVNLTLVTERKVC